MSTRASGLSGRVLRGVVLALFGAFFALPLVALLDFSTTVPATGERSGRAWSGLLADEQARSAILTSLELAALTVVLVLVLLVPTMVWVRLRVPAVTRLLELACLLPLTIPALVLVVGVGNVQAWVSYLFGESPLNLTFLYGVLALPYAYRALDASLGALDLRTLAEAARSLGAGWATVVVRVVLPNIVSGVLGAAFITVALVLGEFTIASLLHWDTLPVVIVLLGKADAPLSMAAALGSILLAAVLLLSLSLLDRGRTSRKAVR